MPPSASVTVANPPPTIPVGKALPAPLQRLDGRTVQRHTGARPGRLAPAEAAVVDSVAVPSVALARATRARLAHQARMDTLAEARAATWLIFAVLCCLVLVVVGTIAAGGLLGAWTVPVGHSG